ncbi:ECF transporter S component [uncultured Thomasclavelia sp.]|uniref:ECF transporter S component n=1 Tax=uncultured Thomasclavelia sp. TaxID=3025759 RepID=UPI0025DC8882|nr:ECF transporter S component [uncultured Thomasclavelia sp.]
MKKWSRSLIFVILGFLIAFLGIWLFNDQRYNLVIILLVIISCLLFYFKYESSHPKTREVVILALMVALTVIGRSLFIMFPSFKPVCALVIITGMVFGKQDGFMCGSLSALISDFIFGIGPWTPFQMLAWGSIGYIAGVLRIVLNKNKYLLYLYALLAGIGFSMFMDLWSVLTIENSFNIYRYLTTIIAALPVTIVYMISNVVFIFLLKEPMVKIMQRVKIKYGILEGD